MNSGATVGLILGLCQALVSLALPREFGGAGDGEDEPEKPAVALIGSGVVGCVTNWIALLWIFQPVDPVKLFGRITLQGCFLKRQPEVSRDFAKFFADRILTARNLLDDAIFSERGSAVFRPRLRRRVKAFLRAAEREGLNAGASGNTALLDAATEAVAAELPTALPQGLYDYADGAFGLEASLGDAMAGGPRGASSRTSNSARFAERAPPRLREGS